MLIREAIQDYIKQHSSLSGTLAEDLAFWSSAIGEVKAAKIQPDSLLKGGGARVKHLDFKRRLMAIQKVYVWLAAQKGWLSNPLEIIFSENPDTFPVEPTTPFKKAIGSSADEVKRMLTAAEKQLRSLDANYYVQIALMLSGLRTQEIVALKWSDIKIGTKPADPVMIRFRENNAAHAIPLNKRVDKSAFIYAVQIMRSMHLPKEKVWQLTDDKFREALRKLEEIENEGKQEKSEKLLIPPTSLRWRGIFDLLDDGNPMQWVSECFDISDSYLDRQYRLSKEPLK